MRSPRADRGGAPLAAAVAAAFAAALVAGVTTGPAALAAEPPLVVHHAIQVTLNAEMHALIARDSVSVPPALAKDGVVRFLIHGDLMVSSVRGDGQDLMFETQTGWNPKDFWERPPYDELGGFDLAKQVTIFVPGGGGAARNEPHTFVIKYGGSIADSLHAPDTAYDRSFETTSGRIVAEGAFLSGASFWVPWLGDHLVTFALDVNVDPGWVTVSQGKLASRKDGRFTSMRWECTDPMEEIFLIAGPYRIREAMHGGVQVMTFCYEDTGDEITDRYIEGTGRYLDAYGERFGPYPFPKFALVENYWQSGFGMPSFTLLGNQVIRLPFILDTSYGHEILHNWWGNGVFVREEGGNWCEGLTTYCADYAAKEKESASAAEEYRRGTLLGYRDFAASGGRDFPLVKFRERESASTQAVGYGKTMMVFHMLRSRVGAAAFDGALRRFYRENLFREADWSDLRRAFEAETGTDLAAWFAEWIEREGAPRLTLEDAAAEGAKGGERAGSGGNGDGAEKGGAWFASGVIVQAEPAFDLHVPVRLLGASDTTWSFVRCEGARTEFRIDAESEPHEIAVDPACEIFRILHEGEIAPALSGVLGARRTRYVIGADVDTGMRRALDDVLRAWGVDSAAVVVEEKEASREAWDGATWVLGRGKLAKELIAEVGRGTPVEGAPGTVVLASRWRKGVKSKGPVAVFVPANPDDAVAIARKIPHYSKSSYLVFDGVKNVAKGLWAPGESPLRVALKETK